MKENNKPNFKIEISLSNTFTAVAGVDEVGRGAIAGPIVAGAVVFQNYGKSLKKLKGVDDSKKLSKKSREELNEIIKTVAFDFSVGEVSS